MIRRVLLIFLISCLASIASAESMPELVSQVQNGLSGSVLAMSPDGRYIVKSPGDEFVHLWTSEGVFLRTLKTPLAYIWSVAFTRDNDILVAGDSDEYLNPDEHPDAFLIDREGTVLGTAPISLWSVFGIAPHADGRSIWAAGKLLGDGYDGSCCVVRLNEDLSVAEVHEDVEGSLVHQLVARPDGAYVISLSIPDDVGAVGLGDIRKIEVYDDRTGETCSRTVFTPGDFYIRHVYPADDGSMALVLFEQDEYSDGLYQKRIRILRSKDADSPFRTLYEESKAAFNSGYASPDGRFFFSISREIEYRTDSWVLLRQEFEYLAWDTDCRRIPLPGDLSSDASQAIAGDRAGTVLLPGLFRAYILDASSSVDRIIEYPELDIGRIRFSPDGKRLYSAGDALRIWDVTGRLIRTVPLAERPGDFTVKPDGNLVLLNRDGFDIYDPGGNRTRTMNWVEVLEQNGIAPEGPLHGIWAILSPEGTIAVRFTEAWGRFFIDDNGVLLAVDEDFILGWADPMVFSRDGSLVLSPTGFNNDWTYDFAAYDWKAEGGPGKVPADHPIYRREAETLEALTLHSSPNPWGHGIWEYGLVDWDDYGNPHDYSPDGNLFVSAGRDGVVRLWDRTGRLLRDFHGHSAGISSVAFHPGGGMFATASGDGSIRFWNHQTGDSAAIYTRGDEWLITTPDGYFDCSPNGDDLAVYLDGDRPIHLGQFALFRNRPDIILSRLGIGDPAVLRDWHLQYLKRLAKSDALPSGISTEDYAELERVSDPKQSRVLAEAYRPSGSGYVLNPGMNIYERFELLSIPAYLEYVEGRFRNNLELPEVRIESSRVAGDELMLHLGFSSSGGSLSSYNIRLDGVPLFEGRGRRLSGTGDSAAVNLPLLPGRNNVVVSCYDEFGSEGLSSVLEVESASSAGNGKTGTLWFLGFGVSDYQDPDLTLVYPAKDVADLSETFSCLALEGYDDYRQRIWVDSDCSLGALEEAREFLGNAKTEDTVVLYISGHGLHDEQGTYFFLGYEANLDDLEGSAINFASLEGLLDGIPPRKKLFLMDTCESGELDPISLAWLDGQLLEEGARGKSIRSLLPSSKGKTGSTGDGTHRGSRGTAVEPKPWRLERDRLIRSDIFQRSGSVVFSSCRGGELSYEPYWYFEEGNGYYTGALINTLQGMTADADFDGMISPGELESAVSVDVAARSMGLQNPVIDRDNRIARLALPVMKGAVESSSSAELSEALGIALNRGQAAWAADLVARGVKLIEPTGQDILVAAASRGDAASCRVAISAGADPNLSGTAGIDPVAAAMMGFHNEALWVLMAEGSRIPPAAVVWADSDGRISEIEELIGNGGELGEDRGFEALKDAVNSSLAGAVSVLLREGVPPNDWSENGIYQPLVKAVRSESLEIVTLLLEAGATVTEGNLQDARKAGDNDMLEILNAYWGRQAE